MACRLSCRRVYKQLQPCAYHLWRYTRQDAVLPRTEYQSVGSQQDCVDMVCVTSIGTQVCAYMVHGRNGGTYLPRWARTSHLVPSHWTWLVLPPPTRAQYRLLQANHECKYVHPHIHTRHNRAHHHGTAHRPPSTLSRPLLRPPPTYPFPGCCPPGSTSSLRKRPPSRRVCCRA